MKKLWLRALARLVVSKTIDLYPPVADIWRESVG